MEEEFKTLTEENIPKIAKQIANEMVEKKAILRYKEPMEYYDEQGRLVKRVIKEIEVRFADS